jgi:selenide,water dikinase
MMLSSWSHGEDAALWSIDERRIGILTVDFITPIVDDPRKFGEIAAANALSDVFAMGGRPLVALNVVGFPTSREPLETLQEILSGGASKIAEAGAILAGGHSVQDPEPKYGLVVFGEVEKGREWRVDGARDGDALILTKPLGVGIAATAIKAGLLPHEHEERAARSMSMLNDWRKCGLGEDLLPAIHACTDVTGFGLAGHALDMLGGGMSLDVRADRLPILDGVREMAAMGLIPAGLYLNREHSGGRVEWALDAGARDPLINDIIYDPETSGGLLLAVERDAADGTADALGKIFPGAARIGEFHRGDGGLRVI